MSVEQEKLSAACFAADLVQPGMLVGLGSGTTAEVAIAELGRKFQQGLSFSGVPTSQRSADIARSFGIPLANLDGHRLLDLNIDGADEVDPDLNCVKGHGGQLLREKIVAVSSHRFVVIADSSKRVERLGSRAPVPVEVIPFGWKTTMARLEALGFTCALRGGETPYITAGQNYILDCVQPAHLELADPSVSDAIKRQIGVVEHGIFLNLATMVVFGAGDGVDVLERHRG